MYGVVQVYTRAAKFQGLTAEESYRLESAGVKLLKMAS